MGLRTSRFDIADYLESEAEIAEYLSGALTLGDPAYFQYALGVVARAKGMATIARKTGLGRQSLYKALSEQGNPEFSTVVKVLGALGIRIVTVPAKTRTTKRRARRAA